MAGFRFPQKACGRPWAVAGLEPTRKNAMRRSTSEARSTEATGAYFAMRFAAAIAAPTPDLARIALISFLAALESCRIAPRY